MELQIQLPAVFIIFYSRSPFYIPVQINCTTVSLYPVPLCPCSRDSKGKAIGLVIVGVKEYHEIIILQKIEVAPQ